MPDPSCFFNRLDNNLKFSSRCYWVIDLWICRFSMPFKISISNAISQVGNSILPNVIIDTNCINTIKGHLTWFKKLKQQSQKLYFYEKSFVCYKWCQWYCSASINRFGFAKQGKYWLVWWAKHLMFKLVMA